jgi:hypothetical protein
MSRIERSSEPRRNRGSSSAVALRAYSYEEFVGIVARQAGLAPVLMPIPFGAHWHGLPKYPRTHFSRVIKVELMEIDTVSSPEMPGFVELGISPRSVEAMLQEMLPKYG